MVSDDIRCPICNLNLQVLTERKREEHCDSCLDNAGFVEPVSYTSEIDLTANVKQEVENEVEELGVRPVENKESLIEFLKNEPGELKVKPSTDVDKPITPVNNTKPPSFLQRAPLASPSPSSSSLAFFDLGKRKRAEVEESKPTAVNAKKTRSKQGNRPVPFYKTLQFGSSVIAVDAFNYGAIPKVSSYFLTHFHSDHYGGLSKTWAHGPIYCSAATARLASLKLKVNSEILKPLELNCEYNIDGINVMLFDANHCPGAVVFLFDKHTLHTGDFRATEQLVKEIALFTKTLNTVYLDTTYLDPDRKFPSQDLVVDTCAEYCAKIQSKPVKQGFFTKTPEKRRILVMVGTYTIGKERLALAIAQKLNNRIWAQPWKQKVLETVGDPALNSPLSDDGTEAQVHLVSMGELTISKLEQKWKFLQKHFTQLIAFVPTGWTWPKNETVFNIESLESSKSTTVSHGGRIRVCRVPYSEHSSYSELERFCQSIACRNLIATVHTKRYDILRRWEAGK